MNERRAYVNTYTRSFFCLVVTSAGAVQHRHDGTARPSDPSAIAQEANPFCVTMATKSSTSSGATASISLDAAAAGAGSSVGAGPDGLRRLSMKAAPEGEDRHDSGAAAAASTASKRTCV
jgi:hypothetical protein